MTDAVEFLRAKSIPMVIFGPGDAALIHKPEESVRISEFLDCLHYYIALAINYLS
jgi:acetylornithine deacetylase/succinyl-diaminopimelate desuccinylase-like protein